MKRLKVLLMLSFALPLVASCVATSVSDGTGYELLTPNAASRSVMFSEDREFATQVAEHNEQCRKDKGCKK